MPVIFGLDTGAGFTLTAELDERGILKEFEGSKSHPNHHT
jgi:hypothetical protein